MSRIRRISIHVDEPDPGHFFWVLMERGRDATDWVTLAACEKPFDLWLDALTEGTVALMQFVPDERIGPRCGAGNEDASSADSSKIE